MTPDVARRLARVMAGVAIVSILVAFAIRLTALPPAEDPVDTAVILVALLFGAMGWLIASRRPENAIGWLFLSVAVGVAIDAILISLAALGNVRMAFPTVVRVADWTDGWMWIPLVFVPTIFPLLLFPDGRLPSRRWRPFVWAGAVGLVLFMFSMAFDPSNYEGRIPIELRPPAALVEMTSLAAFLLIAALIAGVIAIVRRFRRSMGDERQQIKWLAYGGTAGAMGLIGGFVTGGVLDSAGVPVKGAVSDVLNVLVLLAVLLIPSSMSLAILRYRLYEIDVVIKKTIVFGILVLLIMVVAIGLILAGSSVVTEFAADEPLAVGLVGLALGILSWPLYRLSRRIADRVVYRGRSSPYEILTEFSGRMAGAYATEDVLPRLARVLGEGTGARTAVVWLRVGAGLRAEAVWPADVEAPAHPPRDAEPVAHQGEQLGALSVEMPANDPMSPTKARIVRDLAGQAGLILRNVRLIEELRESRRRIVATQDERAKKLERDIHDGAQQQLVALAVKLGLAERLVATDPERTTVMLAEAKAQANDALDDLRDLARGIYPPLLADKGLGAALEAQARKSPLPVVVEPDGIGRYPQEAEAAVYFSCLEALQNVAKYADATTATVRLAQANGDLTFEVADDGIGFDPDSTPQGSGLQGIADRLAALGGELTIRSAAGDGTTVAGRLPLDAVPTAETPAHDGAR